MHVGPVISEPIVFFARKGPQATSWSSFADFSGLIIGATNGYTYTPAFWDAANDGTLNVDVVNDDVTNLKKLLSGRIDLFVAGRFSAWSLIDENFSKADREQFTTLERALGTNDGYLLVSRQLPDAEGIAASLQQGVDTIRQTGLMDHISEELVRSSD